MSFDNFDVSSAIIQFFSFFVAIMIQPAATALMAYRLGDKSPYTVSRATLNPLPHIDIIGTLIFPFIIMLGGSHFLFGWAKPYMPMTAYFKKIKRDIDLVFLAGPAANFLLAALLLLILRLGFHITPLEFQILNQFNQDASVEFILKIFCLKIALANIVIGTLAFLPFSNTTGWMLLKNHLPYEAGRKMDEYTMYIHYGTLLLLLLGAFDFLFNGITRLFLMIIF
jgi:Zn-dependent protease